MSQNNPPDVDVLGNIYVHSRTGLTISVVDKDMAGTVVDISGDTWFFEMPGLRKALVADPNNATGLMLVLTINDVANLSSTTPTPFLVMDETGGKKDDRWEGTIRKRGW